MDSSQLLTTELAEHGRILIVTLNNPPDNAITPNMLEDVGRAIEVLDGDCGPDLGVLTGQGQVFSKGFDVRVVRSHKDRTAHANSLFLCNDVCSRLAECPKPLIAAINGHCLGAGLELAMACHFRLCVEKTRLGLPELARGLIPGLGGIHRLVQLVGRARALDLIAVGDLLNAEDAHRYGLLTRVLPRLDFWQRVLAFARAILAVDQALVREVIRLVNRATNQSHQDSVTDTVESIVRLCPSPSVDSQ